MREKCKHYFSILLAFVLAFTMTVPVMAESIEEELAQVPGNVVVSDESGVEENAGMNSEFMEQLDAAISASYADAVDPWIVLEMVQDGKKDSLTRVDEAVETALATVAESTSATDIAKYTIMLSALGYDVSELDNNGTTVNGIERMLACDLSNVNAKVFALIALDSGNYFLQKGSQITRESLVQDILAVQLADQGWAYSGENADPDMTAMALQALAPYYTAVSRELSADATEAVKTAVEGAVATLANMENSDGTYSLWGSANPYSTAQVVIALSSLGIDAASDENFVKSDGSLLDGLLSYGMADGSGFYSSDSSEIDTYATEQSFRALVAYNGYVASRTAYNIYHAGSLDSAEVTFTMIGDDIHPDADHVAYYKWIDSAAYKYPVSAGATAGTLAEEAIKDAGFTAVNTSGTYIEAVTTPDGETLTWDSNGQTGGWMCVVNGESLMVGMFDYQLQNGDDVVMYYVDNWAEPVPENAIPVPVKTITLDVTAKTIYVSKTTTLKASAEPSYAADKTVSWKSSNTSVATVDKNGKVTGKKAGTATITAYNGTVQATAKITVKAGTIKLNDTSLPLQKGKSTTAVKLKSSTPSGAKITSATTSRKSVATVKVTRGVLKITGKKAGTATITVKASNGGTAKVKITVKKKVNVTRLTISKKNATLKVNKKLNLKVTKNPVTATNKIIWTSSDKKIATVNAKGVVTAKKKGTVTITAKASNGKKVTCKIKVTK